jgi:methionyl aminopeptidase
MRESCLLVSKVHELMAQELKIGKTGLELDKLAEEFIRDHHAKPSFKGYGGFPLHVVYFSKLYSGARFS